MKKILIIGCGLLGSSLLRKIHKKKLAKKIFIYEKSKKNISKIKKLNLPGVIINKINKECLPLIGVADWVLNAWLASCSVNINGCGSIVGSY